MIVGGANEFPLTTYSAALSIDSGDVGYKRCAIDRQAYDTDSRNSVYSVS